MRENAIQSSRQSLGHAGQVVEAQAGGWGANPTNHPATQGGAPPRVAPHLVGTESSPDRRATPGPPVRGAWTPVRFFASDSQFAPVLQG